MNEGAAPERGIDWRKRLDGLIPSAISTQRVVIVGCGSVGSFVASELARAGVGRFILVDPDHVEWHNLTRTIYGYRDVGRLKVDALKDHLLGIFPDLDIDAHAIKVQDLGSALTQLLAQSELVISAVDDPQASGRINRHTFSAGTCALFLGLYKGAHGGEIIISLPGITPCLACTTGGRRNLEDTTAFDVTRTRNYGTGRLVEQVALGSDIHFVSAAGVRIALALLSANAPNNPLAQFLIGALQQGKHYVIFGMTPEYFLFPQTHAKALGQYAFQSVWMGAESCSKCPVCGSEEFREQV